MRFAIFGLGRESAPKLPPVLCVRCGGAGVLGRNAEGGHECGRGSPYAKGGCKPAALRARAMPLVEMWFRKCEGGDEGLLAAAFDPRLDEDLSVGDVRDMWSRVKELDANERHFAKRAVERNRQCPTP